MITSTSTHFRSLFDIQYLKGIISSVPILVFTPFLELGKLYSMFVCFVLSEGVLRYFEPNILSRFIVILSLSIDHRLFGVGGEGDDGKGGWTPFPRLNEHDDDPKGTFLALLSCTSLYIFVLRKTNIKTGKIPRTMHLMDKTLKLYASLSIRSLVAEILGKSLTHFTSASKNRFKL